MKYLVHRATWILRQPMTSVVVGLLMVVTGLGEVASTVLEAFDGFGLRAEHGVIIFGLFQVSKSLLDIVEGVERVEVGEADETSSTGQRRTQ